MRNGLKFWLNFLCLVFVVHSHIVHSSTPWALRKIDTLVIPLFSMMAGLSWGGFLKKTKGHGTWQGIRVLLEPYLFWLFVYFALNQVVMDLVIRHNGWSVSVSDIVFYLLTGFCGIQMWFLITLIYAMLIFTGLFKLFGNTVAYRIVVFALLSLSLILPDMRFITDNAEKFRYVEYYRVWFSWLFPGFCIGALLALPKAKFYDALWIKRWLVPFALVLGFLWLFFGKYRGVALPAATALVLAACAYSKFYAPKWLSATAPYVMGIYLIHALFTSAANVALRLTPENPISECLAWPIAVAVFFVAWFAVWVMRKIPFVKNLV